MDSQNNITLKDVIEKDIFELVGLNDLSSDDKSNLAQKMLKTVQYRTMERFDELLDEDDRPKFIRILEDGDDEKLELFYKVKNFDIEKTMVEEAIKYKTELATYMDFIASTGKSLADLKTMIKNREFQPDEVV